MRKERVRADFRTSFTTIYPDNYVPATFEAHWPRITATNIASVTNLDELPSGPGLYVIFSTYPVDGNSCVLKFGELQAIYRGECATVRERLKSHLFNSAYRSAYEAGVKKYEADPKNLGKSFYKAFWPHCLKLSAGGPSRV